MPALTRAERRAAQRAQLVASLPDVDALAGGLAAVFGAVPWSTATIVAREPNQFASSFPSEIVTCRLDGRELRVLCKYARGQSHAAYGHRGNVAYEAEVYRRVLRPIGSTAPLYHGVFAPSTGECWLVLEYVADAVRLHHAEDRATTLPLTTRWIARFHDANAPRLADPALAFLTRYDAEYFRQWAQRTAWLAAGLHRRFPWLRTACERFAPMVEALLVEPTIIHGEYTPKNTLLQGTRVCPVDWESAAVAAGEIDFASLTDGGWPADLVDASTREYARERWPGGAPAEFAPRLDLARLYWNFRWLGERPEWTTSKRGERRIGYVRQFAERAGLV